MTRSIQPVASGCFLHSYSYSVDPRRQRNRRQERENLNSRTMAPHPPTLDGQISGEDSSLLVGKVARQAFEGNDVEASKYVQSLAPFR
jgi:hypothetical protein